VQLKRYKKSKVLLAVVFDRLARSVFWLGGLFGKRRGTVTPSSKRERIVVIQTGAVGDVVMSLPALRALRAHLPKAKITLIAGAWATAILAGDDVVDTVFSLRAPWLGGASIREVMRFWYGALELRRLHFDVGLDLRGDPRSLLFLYLTGAVERVSYGWHGAQFGEYLLTHVVPGPAAGAHLVDRFLAVVAALGHAPASRVPRIRLADREHDAAQRWRRDMLSRTGADVLIGIHPGAANPLRRWRPERFAVLVGRLTSRGRTSVVVFAGPGEEATAAKIVGQTGGAVVVEQMPLREFIIRVSALDALVALDSSPAHIGAALGVPVIALFGPALPEFVGPIGASVRIVQQGPFECRPCTQERCVHPEASCMDAIGDDAVLSATSEILSVRRRRPEEPAVRL
jgi:ADP-heptose:LPS heptosyltransferase